MAVVDPFQNGDVAPTPSPAQAAGWAKYRLKTRAAVAADKYRQGYRNAAMHDRCRERLARFWGVPAGRIKPELAQAWEGAGEGATTRWNDEFDENTLTVCGTPTSGWRRPGPGFSGSYKLVSTPIIPSARALAMAWARSHGSREPVPMDAAPKSTALPIPPGSTPSARESASSERGREPLISTSMGQRHGRGWAARRHARPAQ